MPASLKIAQFFSSDPDSAGGIQEHVFALSQSLKEEGHQVTIFGPPATSTRWQQFDYQSICDISQVWSPIGNTAHITVLNSLGQSLIQKIDTDFDILHVHDPYVPFVSWKLLATLHLPKVVTFHTAWDDDSHLTLFNELIATFKKTFSEKVNGAIYVSDLAKKRWHTLCKAHIIQDEIHNGVAKIFQPRSHSNDKTHILFLARVVSRKGLKYLLKALAKLDKKSLDQIQVDIVGDGDQLQKMKRLTHRLSLDQIVYFRGEVLGEKRVAWYQQADIFCAPYVDEAFGMTVIEAMACGCSIVGFENDSFRSLFDQYPYPELFVKQKDAQALADALKFLISRPKCQTQISSWGKKKSQAYSWEKNAQQTLKHYRKIIATTSGDQKANS